MDEFKVGRVYKITSPHTDKIYVGSTIKKLTERFRKHLYDYNEYNKGGKRSKLTSFIILGYGDCVIELIEELNTTKNELLKLERKYIEDYRGLCVNKILPIKSIEEKNKSKLEYFELNKEHHLKMQREYYDNNKEQCKATKKIYWEKMKDKYKEKSNCDCGGIYTKAHKARHMKATQHINYITINATNATINNNK